ncbi:MAG TPA: DUF362 domain-containing protein [bacterium]|nr:DUF362 domain-containing protein [bacterium]
MKLSRRSFLKSLLGFYVLLNTGAVFHKRKREETVEILKRAPSSRDHRVVQVEGGEPERMLKVGLERMGGIGRFVKKGATVVIKPNIAWDRKPEEAANTNPLLVGALCRLCLDAGSRRVIVFDRTCNLESLCYENSGIKKSVSAAGGNLISPGKFKKYSLEGAVFLKEWDLFEPALKADVFINLPIAKHHSLAGLTLGLKNLMGIMGGNRGMIHRKLPEAIVDLNAVVRVDLTIIDAYRILLRNGPTGGCLEDVKLAKTLIFSCDRVAADAAAALLFGREPSSIAAIAEASRRGLGVMDRGKIEWDRVPL